MEKNKSSKIKPDDPSGCPVFLFYDPSGVVKIFSQTTTHPLEILKLLPRVVSGETIVVSCETIVVSCETIVVSCETTDLSLPASTWCGVLYLVW